MDKNSKKVIIVIAIAIVLIVAAKIKNMVTGGTGSSGNEAYVTSSAVEDGREKENNNETGTGNNTNNGGDNGTNNAAGNTAKYTFKADSAPLTGITAKAAAITDDAIKTALNVLNGLTGEDPAVVLGYGDGGTKMPVRAYESLTDAQKKYYDIVADAAENYKVFAIKESEIGKNAFSVFVTALDALHEDRPELFVNFEIDMNSTTYKPVYFTDNNRRNKTDDMAAVKECRDVYLAVFDRIIEKMPDGLSNYKKCVYFASVICGISIYDKSLESLMDPFQAYNALVRGETICQGFSQAFMLLCRASGIYCTRMESTVVDHVWNVVETNAGTRYIDVTFTNTEVERAGTDFTFKYFLMDYEDLEYNGVVE